MAANGLWPSVKKKKSDRCQRPKNFNEQTFNTEDTKILKIQFQFLDVQKECKTTATK